ncbi:MAG: hypothetical protein KGL39_21535 [Patescibacteria group bacterium]|nr:hypothetical protein [Patescibacteria group bacterium]
MMIDMLGSTAHDLMLDPADPKTREDYEDALRWVKDGSMEAFTTAMSAGVLQPPLVRAMCKTLLEKPTIVEKKCQAFIRYADRAGRDADADELIEHFVAKQEAAIHRKERSAYRALRRDAQGGTPPDFDADADDSASPAPAL